MMNTSRSTQSATKTGEGVVGFVGKNKVRHDRSKRDGIEIDDGDVGGSKVDNKVRKNGQKTAKSKDCLSPKRR